MTTPVEHKIRVTCKGATNWWWECSCTKKSKRFISGSAAHGDANRHRRTGK